MTEQERKWQQEFEKLQPHGFTAMLESGSYEWSFIQERWEGFLMAKRSQPIVKLPKRGTGFYFDVSLDDVIEALTAAGIRFEVEK